MNYYIDWLGRLWRGPIPIQNLNYARFHGYMNVAPFDPIWVHERSDRPEDCDEVGERLALKAASLFSPQGQMPRLN